MNGYEWVLNQHEWEWVLNQHEWETPPCIDPETQFFQSWQVAQKCAGCKKI